MGPYCCTLLGKRKKVPGGYVLQCVCLSPHSYAIIFCNILVPLIEKVTLPTAFGKGGKKHGGK